MKSYIDLHLEFVKSILNISETDLVKLETLILSAKRLIFVGNGGSAAIASHMATDYSKNGHIKAIAFNDSSLLTCLANDCGFDNLFSKAIELYGEEGDLLIAISSSGKSKDILNAVEAAHKRNVKVVTFTGFDEKNQLRKLGELNIYVNSNSYRVVEIMHLYMLHTILEKISQK